MKDNFIKTVFIIDKSGSMCSMKDDVIGSFNDFIKKQKEELKGELNASLYFFADNLTTVFKDKNIKDVEELSEDSYRTYGSTAMNDAICTVIDEVGRDLDKMYEYEKPSTVMVVIITDGFENSSKKYNTYDVKERITHQTDKYSWQFVYLGADISSSQEAKDLGFKNIGLSRKLDYKHTFDGISDIVTSYRCESSALASNKLDSTLNNLNADYENKTGIKV